MKILCKFILLRELYIEKEREDLKANIIKKFSKYENK